MKYLALIQEHRLSKPFLFLYLYLNFWYMKNLGHISKAPKGFLAGHFTK